jgi:uncharacterized damage-inducible protein DinB
MDPRADGFARLLRLNGRLLLNCLDGVGDDRAAARVMSGANSMAFIVAHMVDARHALLGFLGGSLHNPLQPVLGDARTMEDVVAMPPLATLIAAWQAVDDALGMRLNDIEPASLDAPAAQRYPGGDGSVLGALAFLVQHDSYHLGQLALLRRAHGLPPMKYSSRS